jgi:hypothetical protein
MPSRFAWFTEAGLKCTVEPQGLSLSFRRVPQVLRYDPEMRHCLNGVREDNTEEWQKSDPAPRDRWTARSALSALPRFLAADIFMLLPTLDYSTRPPTLRRPHRAGLAYLRLLTVSGKGRTSQDQKALNICQFIGSTPPCLWARIMAFRGHNTIEPTIMSLNWFHSGGLPCRESRSRGNNGLYDLFCCHLPIYSDHSLSESFVD